MILVCDWCNQKATNVHHESDDGGDSGWAVCPTHLRVLASIKDVARRAADAHCGDPLVAAQIAQNGWACVRSDADLFDVGAIAQLVLDAKVGRNRPQQAEDTMRERLVAAFARLAAA